MYLIVDKNINMAEIYNPEFADDYKSFLFYKARKQLKQETFEIHTFTELKLRYIKDTLDNPQKPS